MASNRPVQKCGKCGAEWVQTHTCPTNRTTTALPALPHQPITLAGQFAQAMKPWELVGWWCEVEQSMGRPWHVDPWCAHVGKGCGDVFRKAD